MKPSNMAVIIALATLVVACEQRNETILEDPDPKGTKWILEFDGKTKLKSETDFANTLNGIGKRWERNVKIGYGPVRNVTLIPPHQNYSPKVKHYPKQGDGVASQHVTQRVGLYSNEDLEKVTRQLQNP